MYPLYMWRGWFSRLRGGVQSWLDGGLRRYLDEDLFMRSHWRRMTSISCIQGTPPSLLILINHTNYSHLLAYTISTTTPQPHRLSALPFRITIPSLIPSKMYQSEFMREMRTTETVKLFARISQRIKTWSRRTFIGDRVPSHCLAIPDSVCNNWS